MADNWKYWPHSCGGIVSKENGQHVGEPKADTPQEKERIGRLFAAAPDLLEALKAQVCDLGCEPNAPHDHQCCRCLLRHAAIAKAEFRWLPVEANS